MKLKVITSFEQERYIDFMCSQGFDVTRVAKGDGGEADTIERMRGYSAVAVMDETFSAPVLEALKDELKILVRLGIGYDKVDTAYAAKLGICCCNTPGVMSAGVAEQTITMMLECARGFYRAHQIMQQGGWDRGQTPARQLEGSTVGLIGFGHIAQRVAQYLQGFNCRILAYDVAYDESKLKELHVHKASLEQIAVQSDFISLHVPLLPATEKLVDAAFLKRMKPTAYLINTSRGGTVDEQALVVALREGEIAGAGLDVFTQEPTPRDNPLRYMDNCFVNPHMATFTQECFQAGFEGIVKCLKEFEAGQIPEFCLNPAYVQYLR